MSEQQTAIPVNRRAVDLPVAETAGTSGSPAAEAPEASPPLIEALKWLFSFPAMMGALLVLRVFYRARNFVVDPDLWWHIKVGQDIVRTHHWPTTDPYSFTAANTPWIAYEWLGEVILGSAAKLGGNVALDAFLIALASAIVLALYYFGALRSGNCKAGFIAAAILSSLAFVSFTLRPQMLGYLFLVLLLIALEWFRKGVEWPVWCLPFLFLAWVNTHGSFIVGIGAFAVYIGAGLRSFQIGSVEAQAWSTKQRMKLETVLLMSLAALLITPYGSQLASYPFDMMFNQPVNVSNVEEWMPMPFSQLGGKVFIGVIVLLVVLQILFRFTWRLEELLLAFGGTVMACLHVRMVMLFVPFLVPIFASMLARWVPPYQKWKDQYLLNAALMACVAAAMIHYAPSHEFLQKQVEKDYPVAAVQYLDTHDVPGPMFGNYGFGGYLVGTGKKTFIDGRGDLFERSGIMYDYINVAKVRPGMFTLLDHYHIASCLLKPDDPLSTVLLVSPNWKRIYTDNTSSIFVRTTPVDSSPAN